MLLRLKRSGTILTGYTYDLIPDPTGSTKHPDFVLTGQTSGSTGVTYNFGLPQNLTAETVLLDGPVHLTMRLTFSVTESGATPCHVTPQIVLKDITTNNEPDIIYWNPADKRSPLELGSQGGDVTWDTDVTYGLERDLSALDLTRRKVILRLLVENDTTITNVPPHSVTVSQDSFFSINTGQGGYEAFTVYDSVRFTLFQVTERIFPFVVVRAFEENELPYYSETIFKRNIEVPMWSSVELREDILWEIGMEATLNEEGEDIVIPDEPFIEDLRLDNMMLLPGKGPVLFEESPLPGVIEYLDDIPPVRYPPAPTLAPLSSEVLSDAAARFVEAYLAYDNDRLMSLGRNPLAPIILFWPDYGSPERTEWRFVNPFSPTAGLLYGATQPEWQLDQIGSRAQRRLEFPIGAATQGMGLFLFRERNGFTGDVWAEMPPIGSTVVNDPGILPGREIYNRRISVSERARVFLFDSIDNGDYVRIWGANPSGQPPGLAATGAALLVVP